MKEAGVALSVAPAAAAGFALAEGGLPNHRPPFFFAATGATGGGQAMEDCLQISVFFHLLATTFRATQMGILLPLPSSSSSFDGWEMGLGCKLR